MDKNLLYKALETLGFYLLDKGLQYEVVAIGGGALLLLGCVVRPTEDLDLVALIDKNELTSAQPLPTALLTAIHEVGSALKLPKNWMNTAPADLWKMGLPEGFKSRLTPMHFGGLTVYYAGRLDQICFKLYASIDQGPYSKHFADLKLLNPTQEELQKAGIWCKKQDISELFGKDLREILLYFEERNELP